MPLCVRCGHEIETQVCGSCGNAMAEDIIKLQSKVAELEREMDFANQELKLLVELLPKVTL